MNDTLTIATLAAALAVTVAAADPAIAQGVAAPALAASAASAVATSARAASAPETLEAVVVTATKRSTTLQKTPISMTAVTGDDLQRRGIESVAALVGEVPGVSIKTTGPGQTEFELRGLSSSGGSSPTTGFYLDDTPLTAPAAAQNGKVVIDPNLYDLDRIEVLRGPQGTLYGSGSMGGTIKLVTRKPELDQFDGSAQVILSGTDGGGFNRAENAMLNVPLVSNVLGLRIVASESHTSGWIDRIVVGDFPVAAPGSTVRGAVADAPQLSRARKVNDTDLEGTRLTLLYKPDDRLTITPMLFFQAIRQGGPNTFDSDPGTLAHYEAFDQPEPFRDNFALSSLAVNYRFDGAELTSATSFWKRSQKITQDQAENFQVAFGLPSVYANEGGIGGGPIVEKDGTRQFSEELRLTSLGDTRTQWLVGAFYSRFVSDWDVYSTFPDAVAAFGTANLISQTQPTKISQKALFGEVSYKLVPTLKASAGLRYYSYDSKVDTTYSGFGSSTGPDAVASNHATQSSDGVNPKLNLAWQATDDFLAYATVAKGFRPGGGNQPIPVDPATALGSSCLASLQAFGQSSAPTTFKPDGVWSYELGEKLSLDQRTTINSAIYYERWNGVQQTVALSCGFPYTDNTGDAEVYGSELEVRSIVASGLTLASSAGYTDAHLIKDVPQTGGHKGDKLQNIAAWTASASVAYAVPVMNDWLLTTRAAYDFVGTRIDATYSPMNHLPSYGLLNVRASLAAEKWTATLFANNLLNRRTSITDTPSISVNPPTFNRISTNQPLTIGVDLNYFFQ